MSTILGAFLLISSSLLENACASNNSGDAQKLALFWHVRNSDEVVVDQLKKLTSSWAYENRNLKVLWSAEDSHYASSPSKHTRQMLREQPSHRFQPIPWNEGLFPSGGREWFELPTLWSLHEYCSASEEQHPGRKSEFVAYMHSKTDKYWRDTMMDELLSEAAVGKCVDNCLRKHKVACGPRFHPPSKGPCPTYKNSAIVTWCHFSGNFWWARCDYIAKLNPPWSSSLISEFDIGSNHLLGLRTRKPKLPHGTTPDIRPYGRYFAEWWMLNDVKREFLPSAPEPNTRLTKDTWTVNATDSSTQRVYSVQRQAHLIEPDGCNDPHRPVLTKAGKQLEIYSGRKWPAFCPAFSLQASGEEGEAICYMSIAPPPEVFNLIYEAQKLVKDII